jgi:hypothetical protein
MVIGVLNCITMHNVFFLTSWCIRFTLNSIIVLLLNYCFVTQLLVCHSFLVCFDFNLFENNHNHPVLSTEGISTFGGYTWSTFGALCDACTFGARQERTFDRGCTKPSKQGVFCNLYLLKNTSFSKDCFSQNLCFVRNYRHFIIMV